MNGLTTISSWGENRQLLDSIYGIIDSKIDFVELKMRKLLDKLRRKEPAPQAFARATASAAAGGSHQSDYASVVPTMPDLSMESGTSELFFEHLENLSRSITILENMKFALREDNAKSVIELLTDDKFLGCPDWQLNEALHAEMFA